MGPRASAALLLAAALCGPAAAAPVATAPVRIHARGRAFDVVTRIGVDRFGRQLVLFDALDPVAPLESVAHVDLTVYDGHAYGDQALDLDAVGGLPHPEGAPEGANLRHATVDSRSFAMAVRPSDRRSGVGSALFEEVVARLRAAGVRTLGGRGTETSIEYHLRSLRRLGAKIREVREEVSGPERDVYYHFTADLAP